MNSKLKIALIIFTVIVVIAVILYFTVIKPKPQPKVNVELTAPDSVPDYEGSVFTDGSKIKNGYYLDPAGTPVGVVKAGGKIYSIDGADVFLGSVNADSDGIPAGGYVEMYGIYPPNSILNQIKVGFGMTPYK